MLQNRFPDILVVVQIALEGAISRGAAQASLAAGQLPQGDLLPWMVAQQFQDTQFPGLSGARIVRIAAHPSVMGAGYGSKAVRELQKYYEGQYAGAMRRTSLPARIIKAALTSAARKECGPLVD